jgi:hypothetical protein
VLIETEQHSAGQLVIDRLGPDVLRRRVHVAKAALDRAVLEESDAAGRVVEQIDSLRGGLGGLCCRDSGDRAAALTASGLPRLPARSLRSPRREKPLSYTIELPTVQ